MNIKLSTMLLSTILLSSLAIASNTDKVAPIAPGEPYPGEFQSNKTAWAQVEGKVVETRTVGKNTFEVLLENTRVHQRAGKAPIVRKMVMLLKFYSSTKYEFDEDLRVDADNIKVVAEKYLHIGSNISVKGSLVSERSNSTRDKRSSHFINVKKLKVISDTKPITPWPLIPPPECSEVTPC